MTAQEIYNICNRILMGFKTGEHINYWYNFGGDYLGLTFNTQDDMDRFLQSEEYKALRAFEVPTRYSLFLDFKFAA